MRPRPRWWPPSSTCTGRGSHGSWTSWRARRPRGSPRLRSRTSWSSTSCSCTTSIPIPVEERVVGALEGVRPYLESHGGNVELVAVEDGVVRVRLEGSCDGCPSSAMTLKLAIEEAVHKAAPEVERVEAENAEPRGGGGRRADPVDGGEGARGR
ncbi:MAG: NifU family protein [Thermoleophilaceae bacterium]